jgi:hypothetical protein
MSEPIHNYPQTTPSPRFPWEHVLFTALAVLAIVGLIILIRKGGGVTLAAAPAVALGVIRANSARGSARAHHREPIDMEFLKAQLRQGASEKVVATPTELKIALNRFFEENNLPPPFESEQHMAKILAPLGLQSKIRSMPGRSERRWYDLAGNGAHETRAK